MSDVRAGREAGGAPIVEVTRLFRFSAAHRMHNPRLSADENRRLYGRCNHPNGHGHTYRLAVTIRGPIVDETGRVAGSDRLAAVVRERVLERFDQSDLDTVITSEDGVTSTTEILIGVLWRCLEAALPPRQLVRLRLDETPNNAVELDRENPA